ncbi:hypothetical protein FA15DRAFT_645501 [Coprinopsis marcescibilis]|uniref:Glutathione S-transferase n=1 Tax=Coprinopsis marcescibilis TaxID=230819 RepID=A0A5C3KMM5_COPMA|nr:hypothetical protein FA15DRAFT_645501 [Coprinopsis marcescibilis]
MSELITLYTAKICPWAHRVELALKESGLEYQRFEVDLQNKPEWYAPQVNPASKVPAIAYGGPPTSPSSPSPLSTKLAESYVLLEFIADISKSVALLPPTPVARAQARFFIETFTSKFAAPWYASLHRGEDPAAAVLPAIDALQTLLPPEGGFAAGAQYTIADAAVTPFLARASVALKHDLGAYPAGEGKAVWETLQNDDKYKRFRQYYADVSSRENFKQTFDEDYILEVFTKLFAESRK